MNFRYMKKLNTGLVHYVFIIALLLFLIVNLSACNLSGNVELNGRDQILDKFKGLHVPTATSLTSDTSSVKGGMVDRTANNELTGDFRYDNLFK